MRCGGAGWDIRRRPSSAWIAARSSTSRSSPVSWTHPAGYVSTSSPSPLTLSAHAPRLVSSATSGAPGATCRGRESSTLSGLNACVAPAHRGVTLGLERNKDEEGTPSTTVIFLCSGSFFCLLTSRPSIDNNLNPYDHCWLLLGISTCPSRWWPLCTLM